MGPEVAIDPRIADRREEVEREQRRRWLVRLGVVSAIFVVVALGAASTRSPLLDVDHVQVHGAERTGRHTVLSAVDDLPGTPMVDVDTAAVRAAVRELPWVASAQVRREWPGTVVIEVAERTAVAAVAVDDRTWQRLDPEGRVLDERPERPAGLLPLLGVDPGRAPGDRLEGLDALLGLARLVEPDDVDLFAGARRAGDDLLLDVAGGGSVLLGDARDLEDKVTASVTLLRRVDTRCLDRVDVRVPSMPTVRRDQACAGPAPPTTEAVVATTPATTTPAATVPDPAGAPTTAPVAGV